MSATSNNTTNMTKESTESERYPSTSIEDTTTTSTTRPADVPIQGECGSHTFQQQQVVMFIDKVSTNSRFVKSPCTKDTARSYLEDSDYDISTAFSQYLKANYTDMNAISVEISNILYTAEYESDLLTRDMRERLSDDRDFVMELVKNYGWTLEYASERLRDDHDIVMAAVKNYGKALYYASERLRDDHDIVMAAVKSHGSILQYASERLQDDHDIVMAAVKNYGKALYYASERLRDDHDIVMAAVKNYSHALRYASELLRDDHDIVIAAVKNHGSTLEYASERLRDDHDFIMAEVKNHGWTLRYASERLRDDHDIVMAAVKNDGSTLQYASERLQDDHDIVMAAEKNCGHDVMYYSSFRLWNTLIRTQMAKVKKDGLQRYLERYGTDNDGDNLDLPHSTEEVSRRKMAVIVEAVKRFDYNTLFPRPDEKIGNRDVAVEVLKLHPTKFGYIEDEIVLDRNCILAYLEHSPDAAAALDDCPDGMTALHRIVRVATQHESALPDDFGDIISAYLHHPRGREAAFMKDADEMTPLDILLRSDISLDEIEMHFSSTKSFSMLMLWWHEQIGIDLLIGNKK